MNKLEIQLKNKLLHVVDDTDLNIEIAAKECANITEKISINFLRYFQQTAELGFYSTGENYGKSHKEVFEEFLKTL